MDLKRTLKTTVSAIAVSIAWLPAGAQCTNDSQYPPAAVAPDGFGALTQISTCSFQQEYSAIGPIIDGAAYQFTCTAGAYITVHQDSYDGPVIGSGYSPVTVTAAGTGDLFAHWNVDSTCATASSCVTTTVQLFLNCTPPTATVTAVDDCDNGQFSLTVNITSLGDASDLDLVYSVNGGADQTVADQGLGSHVIGPFTVGEVVDLTIAHSSDATCNLSFPGLVSANTCPTIINCGGAPLDQAYCYTDNDGNHWHYQSSSDTLPLIIIFSAGSIESNLFDHLRIYDGDSNAGTLLWENTLPYPGTQLAGLQVTAPSGHMYMENSSDGSVSCQSGGQAEWAWQVGCLDCNPATATYNVVTDCDNFQYSIEVHISDLGSDATLDIAADSLGNVLATATDTGVYTVGPFTANIPVTIILSNSENSLCNVVSGPWVNPLCPEIIECGTAAVQATYCYAVNDTMAWHWQAASPGDSLSLRFTGGSIQAAFGVDGDHLYIYDGPDNNSPLLFMHTEPNDVDLTDLQVTSTQQDIYMEMTSDGFGSCEDNSTTPWNWIVGCADCVAPQAAYTVVTDCDNFQFNVVVDVTAMGSNPTITITNDGGAAPLAVTETGSYTVGPFTANVPVTVTLGDDLNELCSVHSEPLVNPLCPTIVECGGVPLDDSYCYPNNDAHVWHWQSSSSLPLIMIFSAGSIESSTFDQLVIYDGPDDQSPIIYQNGDLTTDLAGLQVIASSGDLYMTLNSDVIVSCGSASMTEWAWQVGCLDCTMPTATYNVVTDCDLMSYNVEVNITEMGSDPVLDITNDGGALPVSAPGTGTYTVGPFAAGDTVVITLVNDMNPLCNVSSDPLTNPLCPTVIQCGGATLQETYCYPNNDHHEWHWQSSGGQPLALQFSSGMLESASFDHLTIYDGPDSNSDTLFNHDELDTEDLSGLLVISSGPDIYMTNSSDAIVSCATNSDWTWNWEVGCLDCTNPGASFTMVEDCIHRSFSVAVNVDSTGSSPVVRIANSLSTDTLGNVGTGTTLVGPFPMDSTVTLTVLNETNNLCRIFSPEFSSSSQACVDTVCAATAYEYCYTNNDTAWFAYQGMDGVPLTVSFLSGNLGLSDFVQIYNGLAPIPANLRWQGNLNGNVAGWAVNTTNNYSTMLVRVVSNSTYSCATGEAAAELSWVVQCGAVGIDEAGRSNFEMYPNPTTGELSLRLPEDARGTVEMRVVDLTGRTVRQELFQASGTTNTFNLGGLQSGNYMVTITTRDWVKSERLQIIR